MLKKMAAWLATSQGLSAEDEEVLLYSLTILTTTLGNILGLALLAWLLDTGWETLAVTLPAVTLRMWAGGGHATAPWRCVMVGTTVMALLAWLTRTAAERLEPAVPVLIMLAALAIWRYAPAPAPSKPLGSRQQAEKLRRRALVTLIFWVSTILLFWLLAVPAWLTAGMALGMFWQGLTVVPPVYHWLGKYF
ncbi:MULTISPECIES: accessory gene regulator ArgB-like protein [unclassified Carboxydocella]|uniref:accessory gene regulator ArgB-like protein n=1 Tax=unclassified Carboxydocella TaxID=2685367 RepID=UPI0009AC714B|nr:MULTISPECIES: accessory gene regulator B family protein [unclassified Carboxydocella]GAW29125.1 accessory gene regulator B [Carboxydocella sp. ULO1]GAW32003.1 accessory gene regulator B [Carboxydocella sp. JDF658]